MGQEDGKGGLGRRARGSERTERGRWDRKMVKEDKTG